MALSEHNDESLGRILRAKLIGMDVCLGDACQELLRARKAIDEARTFRDGALRVLVELNGRIKNAKRKETRHG